MNKKEFFYVSNILSLSRFILSPAAVFLILNDNYLTASGIIVIIWLTDVLDGFTARKRNEITELGKIIDPVADKVAIISIAFSVFIKELVPLYFIIIIVIRDILIFSGGVYLKIKYGVVLQSNFIGKLAVFTIGFTFLITVLFEGMKNVIFSGSLFFSLENQELLFYILFFISIVMSVISIISYFLTFLTQLKNSNYN